MKKLFLAFVLLLIPIALYSCSDNNDPAEPVTPTSVEITASPEALTAGYDATEMSVTVKSSADWSIQSDQDWCTVTPTGGSKNLETTVKVKLTANSDALARTGSLVIKSGGKTLNITVTQSSRPTLNVSASTVTFGAQPSTRNIEIQANDSWTATSDTDWCKITPSAGDAGTFTVTISAEANATKESRTAKITVTSGELSKDIEVQQYTDEIVAPEGYTLVWHDEFNTPNGSMPDTKLWYYDEWPAGYVNNELQRYVPGRLGDEYTAIIEDGILNIIARKYNSQVISARINTRELWTYGYFEARLKLPKGKGTWPAFWMMPSNGGNWPHCGEIDIMEEVGVNPNYTSSSIHCTAYNHTIGTQKTAERYTAGAEEEFHVYALEWTPEYIRTYVDGQPLLYFANDGKNNDDTWPFNKPFHPILNLAWGGDWGGWNGVNENALPATYQIDYVRIFQKND